MPKYTLNCVVTVSAYTIVEADTLEDAIEQAGERTVELGFDGSGNDPENVWCIEEADGIPEDITGYEE
jgi:hypothetical protein